MKYNIVETKTINKLIEMFPETYQLSFYPLKRPAPNQN